MNRKIIETDIEQLSKTIKAMESEQERKLKQAVQQRNVYRTALTEIQAIAGKSKNYSSTATKIYNKCSEVL